jgi:hypothetical protein
MTAENGQGPPMARRSKREFDRELTMICKVLKIIDAGGADHLFADAETKAAAKAEWEAKMTGAIQKFARAYPGDFYETADGKIGALPEGAITSNGLRSKVA